MSASGVFISDSGHLVILEGDASERAEITEAFTSIMGVAILADKLVALYVDPGTQSLHFRSYSLTDLSLISTVDMDPTYGDGSTGAIQNETPTYDYSEPYVFGVCGIGGHLAVLNNDMNLSSYNIRIFDVTTGALVIERITMFNPAVYQPLAEHHVSFVLNHAQDKFLFVATDMAAHPIIFEAPVDLSADATPLSWGIDDLGSLTTGGVGGVVELPSGNFLLAANALNFVEVQRDGTHVRDWQTPPFDSAHLPTPPQTYTAMTGLALDGDGLSCWTMVDAYPSELGYPLIGGSDFLQAWPIKVSLADGSLLEHRYIDTTQISENPATLSPLGLPAVSLSRGATDDAPAVDSAHRSIWRPTGELISNPVVLHVVRKPVPTPPLPPPPEPIPPPPPPVFNPVTLRRQRRETTIRPPGRRVRENTWASDVPVSRPVPPERAVLKDMGGFGFTSGGLAHNINDEQVDEIFTPTFSPPPTRGRD